MSREAIVLAIDAVQIGPRGLQFTNALTILANEIDKPTQADLRGAPRVPKWEDFAEQAVLISQRLFDKLEAALAAGAPLMELEAIRKQIEQLGNEVRVAGLVIGLMSPFKPKRRKTGMITKPITFTTPLNTIKTIFPWLQTAWDFLSNKQVVKASDFASLSIDQQQAAFTAPGMEDRDELKKLRDEIAKGQNQEEGGESLADFRKRIGDSIALTRSQTEAVFRTNVKGGYVTGFEQAAKSPLVKELFPAVMLSATHDNRVRELHHEMDGFVCLKSDPAYKLLLRLVKDWGCILPGGEATGDFVCGVESFYEGQAVEIETLVGTVIRVTKNHPILTADGFIAAGKLNCGDKLLLDKGCVEESWNSFPATLGGGWASQKYDVPTKVEDIFGSLAAIGFEELQGTMPDDFHGEAERFKGDVRMVWADRELLRRPVSISSEHGSDVILETPLLGGVSGGDLIDPVGIGHGRPFEGFGLASRSSGDAVSLQSLDDRRPGDAESITDALDGRALIEQVDDRLISYIRASATGCLVKSVRHFGYSGIVYDFETKTGVIVLNGVLIGNCRCNPISLTLEQAEEYGGLKTIDDIRRLYPDVMAKYGQGL